MENLEKVFKNIDKAQEELNKVRDKAIKERDSIIYTVWLNRIQIDVIEGTLYRYMELNRLPLEYPCDEWELLRYIKEIKEEYNLHLI